MMHRFMDGRAVVEFGGYVDNRIEYAFTFDGKVLFKGADFRPSPLWDDGDRDAALGLLGFLTLQPGDTDDEYFEKYTTEQKAWSTSHECEQLACEVFDEQESAGRH